MKNTLAIMLLAISPLATMAQKNNVFADVDLLNTKITPGASVTYSRKLVKYFGVGIGVQEYNQQLNSSPYNYVNQFTPGIFADVRGYLPVKRSLFFAMADFGIDIYHDNGLINEAPHNNGFSTDFGIGYCYRINKRGMGPYISLKVISDSYRSRQTDPVTLNVSDGVSANGTSAISVGFKF